MINYVVFVVLYFVCMVNGEGCPNDCSAHGRCNYNQICECFEGYMGGDCSLYKCPLGPAWVDFATNDDTAHALAECSNKGMCKRESGQCLCLLGFTGQACERTTCPNSCNGVGKCQSLTFYAKTKDPGLDMDTYPGPPDEINKVFTYNDRWDASMIYGCSCDSRFHGYDCSLQRCPTGDDPKTPNQFNEIQRCVCKAGGVTLPSHSAVRLQSRFHLMPVLQSYRRSLLLFLLSQMYV